MSSVLDRLRRLQSLREQKKPAEAQLPPPPQAPDFGAADPWGRLEELVPGQEVENELGTYYVSTRAVPLHQRRGPQALGDLLTQQPAIFAPFHPQFRLDGMSDFRQAAFLDTETTGLGAGAGVYCFMVGVGTFETWDTSAPGANGQEPSPTHFVVRQFFMRHPGEEGAMLAGLADFLARCSMTVTFNGRTFDLPLLRTRFFQNRSRLQAARVQVPLLAEDGPHLDLLHPARRLWRRRLQSCRLLHLEQQILGWQRSEEDVPGHLIPLLYADYLRSGNARPMRRVFYHNQEDIVTMVALAGQLSHIFNVEADGSPAPTPLHGPDWLALGHCHERAGCLADAESAYRQAVELLATPQEQAEAFRRLGLLLKRQGRWSEAVEIWQRWLSSVPGTDPTPFEELAKYCEWQLRDLAQAEMWTSWALHTLRREAARPQADPPTREAIRRLEHRLQRLQRKQAGG
ncbi:MAG: hypothetical protein KatS3mg050_2497 [Litorilinea sp.]|nr:MAG: hypothetical protein KatS3mg050_2497 [Litorilinea sp.]